MFLVFVILGGSVLIGSITVLVSMCCIIWGARNNHLLEEDDVPPNNPTREPSWNSLKKNLVKQAYIYIGGFFFVFTFPTISIFFRKNRTVLTLRLIFLPLQGFTNSVIFIYHKVHNIRREYPDVGILEAIHFAVVSSKDLPEVRITGISKVNMDMMRRENRGNVIDSLGDDHLDVGSVVAASKNVHMSGFSEEVSFMLGMKFSSSNKATNTERENAVSSTPRTMERNNILSHVSHKKSRSNVSSNPRDTSGNVNMVSSNNLMSFEPSSNFFSSGIPEELSYDEKSSNDDPSLGFRDHPHSNQNSNNNNISSSSTGTCEESGGTGSDSNQSNKTFPETKKQTKLSTNSE